MADTPSTGNTTPTVDQATPTDTTTAQSTGETVQLAAAAATVQVSAPARGAEASLTVEPGQTVELKDPVARYTQDGGDLVIHWANGAHTTIEDALAAGTPLILADGTTLSSEQVIARIEGFDPGAIEAAAAAVEPAAVEPAAGPVAGQAAGGAFNTVFDNGNIGEGLAITGLLDGTGLQFGVPGAVPELAGLILNIGLNFVTVTDKGTFIGGFEDWQPDQNVGDFAEFPMRLDISGSGPIASVVISGIPFDVEVFIGDPPGTAEPSPASGTYSVAVDAADLDSIFFRPPDDSDVDIPVTVTATGFNGVVTSASVTAVVDAVADLADVTFTDDAGGPVLQSGDATDGSAIKITLDVEAGDVITFDFNFISDESQSDEFNDFSFVTINGQAFELADVLDVGGPGPTGFQTFTFTATSTGPLELGMGVMDVSDDIVDAHLLVDNLQVNGALVTNGSFESGGFAGWSTLGTTTVVSSFNSESPTDGGDMANLQSDGSLQADIEAFVGLPPGTLDNLALNGALPTIQEVTFREDNAVGTGDCLTDGEPVFGAGFTAAVTDTDGSERIKEIVIRVPEETTDNPDLPDNPDDHLGLRQPLSSTDDPAATNFLIGNDVVTEGATVQVQATYIDATGTLQSGLVDVTATFGVDADGNATMTLSFDPFDPDFQIQSVDLSNGSGSEFEVRLPQHSDDDFRLQLDVTSTENPPTDGELTLDNNESTQTAFLYVEVQAVADEAVINFTPFNPNDPQTFGFINQVFSFDEDGTDVVSEHGFDDGTGTGNTETPLRIPLTFVAEITDVDGSESITEIKVTLNSADPGAKFVDETGADLVTGTPTVIGVDTFNVDVTGQILTLTAASPVPAKDINMGGEVQIQLPIDDSTNFSATFDVTTTELNAEGAAHDASCTVTATRPFVIEGVVGPAATDNGLNVYDGGDDGFVASSSIAPTVVIDFETLAHVGTVVPIGEPYNEDGFTLSTNDPAGQDFFVVGSDDNRHFGTASLGISLPGDTAVLMREGGGEFKTFNLESIDLAENELLGTPSVTFTGNVAGGGPVFETFTLDGFIGGQTFDFNSSFRNLTSVTWDQDQSALGHIFDNIVVTPVVNGLVTFVEDGERLPADHGGTGETNLLIALRYITSTQDDDGTGTPAIPSSASEQNSEGITKLVVSLDGADPGARFVKADGSALTTGDTINLGDGASGTVTGTITLSTDSHTMTLTFANPGVQTVQLDRGDGLDVKLPVDDSTDFRVNYDVTTTEWDDDAFSTGSFVPDSSLVAVATTVTHDDINFEIQGVVGPAATDTKIAQYDGDTGFVSSVGGVVTFVEDGTGVVSEHGSEAAESELSIALYYTADTQDDDNSGTLALNNEVTERNSEGITELKVTLVGADPGAAFTSAGDDLDPAGGILDIGLGSGNPTYELDVTDNHILTLTFADPGVQAVDLHAVDGLNVDLPVDDSTDFSVRFEATTTEWDDDNFDADGTFFNHPSAVVLSDGTPVDDNTAVVFPPPTTVKTDTIDFQIQGVVGDATTNFGTYEFDANAMAVDPDPSTDGNTLTLTFFEDGDEDQIINSNVPVDDDDPNFGDNRAGPLLVPIKWSAHTEDGLNQDTTTPPEGPSLDPENSEGITQIVVTIWGVDGETFVDGNGDPLGTSLNILVDGVNRALTLDSTATPADNTFNIVTDTGAETVSLTITFPDSTDVQNVDLTGFLGVLQPQNSDNDFAVKFETTTTEFDDNSGAVHAATVTTTDTLNVIVDAVADPVTVTIEVRDDDGEFEPGETGSVGVVASFGDVGDGSETHTVTVEIPDTFTVVTPSGNLSATGTPVDVAFVGLPSGVSAAIVDADAADGHSEVVFTVVDPTISSLNYSFGVTAPADFDALRIADTSSEGGPQFVFTAIAEAVEGATVDDNPTTAFEPGHADIEFTDGNNTADTLAIDLSDADDVPTAGAAAGTVNEEDLGAGLSLPFHDGTNAAGTGESVSGTLVYDFGPDSAGATFAWTGGRTTVTADGDDGADPIGGDAFPGSFPTSGGDFIDWIVSGGGLILTGMVDVAGTGPYKGLTVATAEITDVATGAFTFTLFGPFDHPDSAVSDPPGGQIGPDDLVNLHFGFTVTDGDGDTADGTLDISVTDDGPTISTTGIEEPTLTVDETDLATNASANFAANFSSNPGADGEQSTTYALSVSASGVDSGLDDTATGNSVFLFLNVSGMIEGREGTTPTTAAAGNIVFTVSVDGSGTVALDQIRAVVHPITTDPDDSVTLSADNLVQLTATITDNDGDTASATRDIGQNLNFEDDGPTVTAAVTDGDTVTLTTQDADTIGAATDTDTTTADFTGAFSSSSSSFGADGPGSAASLSYGLSLLVGVEGTTSGMTSGGRTIFLYDLSGVIVGSTSGTIPASATDASVVFSLSVDSGTGVVTLTQRQALDHDSPGATSAPYDTQFEVLGTGLVQLSGTATITDGDGDQASDTQTLDLGGNVRFADDGPSMTTTGTEEPTLTVDETDLATDASASFAANFSGAAGADGEQSTTYALSVSASGVDSGLHDTATGNSVFLFLNVSGEIEGREGTTPTTAAAGAIVFTVSVDGSGTVTLDQVRAVVHPDTTNPNDSVSLFADNLVQLTATITDKDGDSASATRDIGLNLNFADDGPTVTAGNDGVLSGVVSETNLLAATAGDAGNQLDAVPTTTSGNFFSEVSFGADGEGDLETISIGANGVTVTGVAGQVITSDLLGQPTGLWTLTVNVGGVAGDFTFTLLDNTATHSGVGDVGSADTVAVPEITATVTDGDGDSLDITLNIAIEDDGPSVDVSPAVADGTPATDSVVEGDTISGTWTSAEGADGAATVVSSGTALDQTLVSGSLVSFTTAEGTLTVFAQDHPEVTKAGTWEFVSTDGAPSPSVSFTVKLTDADGDVVTDTHTIDITSVLTGSVTANCVNGGGGSHTLRMTFTEVNNSANTFAAILTLLPTGGGTDVATIDADVGFFIDPAQQYIVTLDSDSGTVAQITGFALEGVDIVTAAFQIDPGAGAASDGLTSVIQPDSGEIVDEIPFDITDGHDRLGGDNLGDNFAFGLPPAVADAADTLTADGDNDFLFGGNLGDIVTGGSGNDVLLGGAGDDDLFGDFGVVNATTETGGNDTLLGGAGNDLLVGDADFVTGFLSASGFPPVITFNSGFVTGGNDVLRGGAGDDELFGDVVNIDALGSVSGGADTLIGGPGNDTLTGDVGPGHTGGGADTYVYESIGDGNDVITNFPDGADVVDLDVLFDNLGGTFTDGDAASNAVDRAAAVNLDNSTSSVGGTATDAVLTVDDSGGAVITGFSITFQDVTLTDPTGGSLTVADLTALGIDVGG